MKILFMGTPDFAVFSLRAMVEAGENVAGVVTQPDQPKGRGYVMTPPPVKVYAMEHGIPVYQPETLRNGAFEKELGEIAPDLIVVTAYGKILPQYVLDAPRMGCVNVHASLLPAYRGAAPMQRAIMDGQAQTGVTTMMMDAGLDTGDVLLQGVVPIGENDNFETVHDNMGKVGADVLLRTLDAFRAGSVKRVPQDGSKSTYAAKIEKSDCVIDFSRSAEEVHNQIRGLSPVPLAFTRLPNGKLLKIVFSTIADKTAVLAPAGTVVALANGAITVACGRGAVNLTEVVPEGKSRMSAAAFINGRNICTGEVLGESESRAGKSPDCSTDEF